MEGSVPVTQLEPGVLFDILADAGILKLPLEIDPLNLPDDVSEVLEVGDRALQKEYEATLERKLQDNAGITTAHDLSVWIKQAAKSVFSKPAEGRQVWFDSDCINARREALRKPEEEQQVVFKFYMHFIRARRRRFLRKQQLVLTQELSKDPHSFWGRFRTPSTPCELLDNDLMAYVEKLYHFPDVARMPGALGVRCIFTEEEVARALAQLHFGKAADLEGLTIELLRWGGPLLPSMDQLIAECKTYKYLGIDFSANLSWADCWKDRVACGFRALFSLGAKCRRADLIDWTLRIRLFDTLVKTAVMYGIPVWGPTISKTGWKNIESIQKAFLQSELGVRPQVPYVLLLSESGRLPLEAEALFTTIRYAQHLRSQDETRFTSLAWSESRARGWQADVRRWADRWGILEDLWNLTGTSLRSAFSALVVEHLWSDPSCRQKYYLRDVTRLDPYKEQTYLRCRCRCIISH
ncbi:hypothetical protein R1sor_027232 [Riccia sorocarpa]|uniref:Uncharacterized protein n=1 Tax=Riccia sorocarpa TaxID=122646 RepID=A0ABD3GJD7_9MARC